MLVIEDGTGRIDANSWVSLSEMRAFAEARGVELSTSDSDVESKLVQAADFISLYEPQFQGRRLNASQALSFPRVSVTINCEAFPSDLVPEHVKKAQMLAVVEMVNREAEGESINLASPGDVYPVRKEKIDVIEFEYMTPLQQDNSARGSRTFPTYPLIESALFGVSLGNECPGSLAAGITRVVRI